MIKEIDFIRAHNTRDLAEFIELVFPEEWKPLCARIIESGAEYSTREDFAPKWTPIPYTERNGSEELETALKSTIFRVHDCLHQLWGLPIPTAYDEDNFYQFKRAWMCAEVAVLTLTEFVYCKWLFDTQPHVKNLLMKRNTLLFMSTTELKYKTTREIAARLDQLLHKKINPKWVRDNVHARIFLEDFIPMLETDRTNIDHNWQLLKEEVSLEELSMLPNQRYSSHLDGLELTTWMIDDFYHLLGTDEQIDHQLKEFNKERRRNLVLPKTWNTPEKKHLDSEVDGRETTFKENEEFIQNYIMETLSTYLEFVDEDDEEIEGSKEDITIYHEGDNGWDCKGESNPIDKCVYSMNLSFGDDACVFCGEPEERK